MNFSFSMILAFVASLSVASAFLLPSLSTSQVSLATSSSSLTQTTLFNMGEAVEEVVPITPLLPEDYIAIGLACCFLLDADTQKVEEAYIYEPLTAGTIETISLGTPTSYKRVVGMTVGELFAGNDDINNPTTVNSDALQQLCEGMPGVTEAENFVVRTLCAARTFRRRVEAKDCVAIGNLRENFNFDTTRKRILNEVYEPSFDDNVKQDASIDVYGRNDDVDAAEIERLANA
jgi:hypothetical protein